MNKLFEMTIEDEMIDGVYAVSLVENPAIMEDYIMLSKEDKIRIDLKLEKIVDQKRHIVCGPALIPEIIIPRNGYDITFSKETIRKISENFMINGNKDNVTVQHKVNINKVKLVESWIIEDAEKDKSTALGFNLPSGTWMISMKIQDDALWSEFIESKRLKGFSIEGNFTNKEVNLHEHCEHNHEELEEDKELFNLYLALNYTPNDLASYYVWKLGPNDNNCPSCLGFNGKVKKLREWINTAIPAVPNGTTIAGLTCNFPYSPYGTYCEQNCKCKLVKFSDAVKKSIKKPF